MTRKRNIVLILATLGAQISGWIIAIWLFGPYGIMGYLMFYAMIIAVPLQGHEAQPGPVKQKAKRLYTWTCQFCQIEFKTENYSQRYCKPSHRVRASELRRQQRENIP